MAAASAAHEPQLEVFSSIPFPLAPQADNPYYPPLWFTALNSNQKDPLLLFHDEILAFARWVSPNSAERGWREQIIERLAQCVRSMWPTARVRDTNNIYHRLNLNSPQNFVVASITLFFVSS